MFGGTTGCINSDTIARMMYLGYNQLKHDIDRFESMGLYPTADLTKYPGYGSLGHKILKKVINNRITLTALYIYFKITNIF